MLEQRLPKEVREGGRASVAEVMVPWDDLAVVSYRSLRYLKVDELCEMLHDSGSGHVIVLDSGDHGSIIARGMISGGALKKRLQATYCMSAS
jgi:hypothetical protein